jgi:hypothetical protein
MEQIKKLDPLKSEWPIFIEKINSIIDAVNELQEAGKRDELPTFIKEDIAAKVAEAKIEGQLKGLREAREFFVKNDIYTGSEMTINEIFLLKQSLKK